MRRRLRWVITASLCLAGPLAAQTANPVANAFRAHLQKAQRDLLASADLMPPEKYGYKPTPANMSFAQHMTHMGNFNQDMCALIGGVKAPDHTKLPPTASKQQIVDHLKESFTFCGTALAGLEDKALGDTVTFYGSPMSRAGVLLILSGDWYDHYAVTATYLRLNGLLPPTARS